ncbi:membrane protein [Geothrix oryzae]|uniref:Membrane protein n=1 Tax=Geothrix oryzae TaxID=2927975 RepID=A0ABN6UVG6_9BACT|nr:OmpA family protein [Geothrix oryzae]BDU68590.1 membrane protein [Geothrix oryzae]
MNRASLFLPALLAALPVLAQADKAGCKDHPLLPTRMPGYILRDCKTEAFGRYEFWTPNAREKVPVEGKFTFLTYTITDRKNEPSAVAVVRNYENAILKAGGKVLHQRSDWLVNGTITKDGRETWVQAERGNGTIWLRIVEKQAMTQYIVADAAAMGGDLAATGHVAIYGIYFDTGKAEVKPESKPALAEIARLLGQSPALKLKVVGHTDMTGGLEANMKLSQARAEAVVQALISQHGLASSRLKGYGVGPLAPVASNDTEEGKGKNRRVELVKE